MHGPAKRAPWCCRSEPFPSCDAVVRQRESRDGKTNLEIAKYLFVSPHTVSAHFRHSFEFGSQVSGQLTSVAADADWTSPERAMHGGAAPVTLASRYAVS